MRRPPPTTVEGLLAQIDLDHHNEAIANASGWVVVCSDDESESLVYATGLFPDPWSALAEANRQKGDDAHHDDPGEPGWTYHVLPVYPPATKEVS